MELRERCDCLVCEMRADCCCCYGAGLELEVMVLMSGGEIDAVMKLMPLATESESESARARLPATTTSRPLELRLRRTLLICFRCCYCSWPLRRASSTQLDCKIEIVIKVVIEIETHLHKIAHRAWRARAAGQPRLEAVDWRPLEDSPRNSYTESCIMSPWALVIRWNHPLFVFGPPALGRLFSAEAPPL